MQPALTNDPRRADGIYERRHEARINNVSVNIGALSQTTGHNGCRRRAQAVLIEPIEEALVRESQREEFTLTNDATFGFSAERVAAQVESDGRHADVKEVLRDDVHLVSLAHLASLQQNEAELHEDDVHGRNDNPVLEQLVLEHLRLVDVVKVACASEILREHVLGGNAARIYVAVQLLVWCLERAFGA